MSSSERLPSFKRELERLINKYSLEGGSDTPDFLLADYLVQCLAVFDVTMAHREAWYGRAVTKPAVIILDTPVRPGDPEGVPHATP